MLQLQHTIVYFFITENNWKIGKIPNNKFVNLIFRKIIMVKNVKKMIKISIFFGVPIIIKYQSKRLI